MRISDWSSDVCSSDRTTIAFAAHAHLRLADQRRADPDRLDADGLDPRDGSFVEQCACFNENGAILAVDNVFRRGTAKNALTERSNDRTALNRSEEHTSELQSLMRISYAVFCLKKTKPNQKQ